MLLLRLEIASRGLVQVGESLSDAAGVLAGGW